ncbi:response regulator [Aggregatilineales bacterium SYSU G02658]
MPALKVLVVEDDIGLCVIYERILVKMDCQVKIARDGHYALQLLQTFTPHLIFLDIYLPFVNGLTVLESIASKPELDQTHVVVSSSSRDYERKVLQYPNTQFILKPIMPTQIRDVVTTLIESTR